MRDKADAGAEDGGVDRMVTAFRDAETWEFAERWARRLPWPNGMSILDRNCVSRATTLVLTLRLIRRDNQSGRQCSNMLARLNIPRHLCNTSVPGCHWIM